LQYTVRANTLWPYRDVAFVASTNNLVANSRVRFATTSTQLKRFSLQRMNQLNLTQQATSKGGSQEERSSQELNHIPDSLNNSQVAF